MKRSDSISVLSIPFYSGNIPDLVEQMVSQDLPAMAKENRCISASGAHGLVEASKDPGFKNILQNYWLNLPDGMPIVWIGKWKGAKQIARCYGPDFFKAVMIATANKDVKHFFCGGMEGVAEQLKASVKAKFNNDNVVGTFCPPFRPMTEAEMTELGNQITASGADMVWVAIGCPKQEKLAYALKKYTSTKFIVAVGAAFDFHTDRVPQAPSWVQKIGMEWFFRLLMEPRRLFKRYVVVIPTFIWLNLKDFMGFYFRKNSS